MRIEIRSLAVIALAISPCPSFAQTSDPCGEPKGDSTLTGRGATVWSTKQNGLPPKIDWLTFDSNARDRWYPKNSFDGGKTFTRDPGAFSGRADRAHEARASTAREYRAHQGLAGGTGVGATLGKVEGTRAAGYDGNGFRNGRAVVASGRGGHLAVDVLRAEGGASGDAQANLRDGVSVNGAAGGRATLGAVTGQSEKAQIGGKVLGAGIAASGRAGVMSEASANGSLALGFDQIAARAGGEVFAGARAGGEIPTTFTLFGTRITTTVRGDVRAGAGAGANGYAAISNGALRLGCAASACLGLGAGAGADVELDPSETIQWIADAVTVPRPAHIPAGVDHGKPFVIGKSGDKWRVSVRNCIGSRTVQLWSDEMLRKHENAEWQFRNPFGGAPPARPSSPIVFNGPAGDSSPRHADTTISSADRAAIARWLSAGGADGAGMARE